MADVMSGDPQGSVLGSLLFAIYILNLSSVPRRCSRIASAGDLQIYFSVPHDQLPIAIDMVEKDFHAVNTWETEHCLQLNPGKSNGMILGSARYRLF